MSWTEHHLKSEQLAIAAELAARAGQLTVANDLYRQAAEAEELAFAALEPEKKRTRGITAVSAVALMHKSGAFAAAEALAHRYSSEQGVPDFALKQLKTFAGTSERAAVIAELPAQTVYHAIQSGAGAIAQGEGARAAGAGGFYVGGEMRVSGRGNAVGVANTVSYTETKSSSSGVTVAEFAALLKELRQGAGAVGLDEKTRRAVEEDLDRAHAEAGDAKPSGAIILSRLKGVAALVEGAGKAAEGIWPRIQQAIEWAGRLWG